MLLTGAAIRVAQRKPREVAKNQMLDNNTSCAIRKIRSGKMILFEPSGPIFEKKCSKIGPDGSNNG